MLERIRYINHLNEEIEIGTRPIYANSNELRDYAWSYTARNNRISSFYRAIAKKTLPILIACKSKDDGYDARNRLFEVFEKDVLANKPGKFVIGDYYLGGFVTESKKSDYIPDKRLMRVTFGVVTDKPYWISEKTTKFIIGEAAGTDSYLDYLYDYSYDYANSLGGAVVFNSGIRPANFRMVIYGYQLNPSVYIGGHEYTVNAEILDGEYLTVDTVKKTIVLTRKDGTEVNCYKCRNRDSYIFEQMPVGENVVTAADGLRVDITILDERSEPKWT